MFSRERERKRSLPSEVMHWFLPTLHRDKSTSWIPMSFSYWGNATQSKRHEAHYNVNPCFYFSSTFPGNVFSVIAWKWDIFVMRFFSPSSLCEKRPHFHIDGEIVSLQTCRRVNVFTVDDDAEVYSVIVIVWDAEETCWMHFIFLRLYCWVTCHILMVTSFPLCPELTLDKCK